LSLKYARELAAMSIQRAQSKYKEQYDKSAASTPFTVGDLVLVHFPKKSLDLRESGLVPGMDHTGSSQRMILMWK